jgi:DNA-directed RNA polymerase subunit K
MAEKEHYSKYEKARIIGSRALQISMGAPFLIKISKELLEKIKFNPVEIAKMEYDEGVIPITVRRPMPLKKEKKEN